MLNANANAVLIEPCSSNLVFCYDAVVQYGVLWTEYSVYIYVAYAGVNMP